MARFLIFDLDQTLVNTSILEPYRRCIKLPKWNDFSPKVERVPLALPSGSINSKSLAPMFRGGINQRRP